jgi:DNA modification methylase
MGAEETSRRCFMMELDPAYTDVIVTRWQEATGRKAVLEAGGATFEAIAAARNASRDE